MAAADLIAEINRIRAEMRDGPRFEALDPPYSTIQVNQIKGGLHGNVLRIAPPLTLTTSEAAEGLAALVAAIEEVTP